MNYCLLQCNVQFSLDVLLLLLFSVDLSGAAARMSDIPEQAKKTGAIKKTYPNRNREMGEASTSGAAERRDDPDGRQSRNSESSNTRKHNRKNKMDKRDERSFEFIMEQVEDFSDSDKFKYLADRYKSLYEEVCFWFFC